VFELIELIGPSSHNIAPDLVLEAIVECGGEHLGVAELSFQHNFLEYFCVAMNRPSLLDSVVEALLGFLPGVQIGQLELEVFLKRLPVEEVVWHFKAIIIVCLHSKFQLDLLPVCCPVSTELEGPLDLDLIRGEVGLVECDVVVALCKEGLGFGGGPVEWSGECDLQRFPMVQRG